MLEPEQVAFISGYVETHMGQYNTKWNSSVEIMPKPKTGPQNLVHLADYLASRKFLTFEFGDDYYEPPKPESSAPVADSELDKLKADIVTKCKARIESGISNKVIYAMIAEENGGNRNPNSISDIVIANNVLHKLEELNV